MGARQNGPLGFQLRMDDGFASGLLKPSLPLRLTLPGSMGTKSWHMAAGLNQRKKQEHENHPPGNSPLEKFQLALMDMQIKKREGHGRKAVQKLEDGELDDIPDKKKMRKDVAALFNKMWAEMKTDYKTRSHTSAGDSVGVASGYRSAEQDRKAWYNAFPKYYKNTLKDRL